MNNHSPIHFRGFNIFFIGWGALAFGDQQPERNTNKYHDQQCSIRGRVSEETHKTPIPHEPHTPQEEGRKHLVGDVNESRFQEFHGGNIHDMPADVKWKLEDSV